MYDLFTWPWQIVILTSSLFYWITIKSYISDNKIFLLLRGILVFIYTFLNTALILTIFNINLKKEHEGIWLFIIAVVSPIIIYFLKNKESKIHKILSFFVITSPAFTPLLSEYFFKLSTEKGMGWYEVGSNNIFYIPSLVGLIIFYLVHFKILSVSDNQILKKIPGEIGLKELGLTWYIPYRMLPALLIGVCLSLPISIGIKALLDSKNFQGMSPDERMRDVLSYNIFPFNITCFVVSVLFLIYVSWIVRSFILYGAEISENIEERVYWCLKALLLKGGIAACVLIAFYYLFGRHFLSICDGGSAAFVLFISLIINTAVFYSPFSYSGIFTRIFKSSEDSMGATERLHAKYESERREKEVKLKIKQKKASSEKSESLQNAPTKKTKIDQVQEKKLGKEEDEDNGIVFR